MPRKKSATPKKKGRPLTVTDAAVELAVDLLARRIHKSVIKKALSQNPHNVKSARSAERVLTRARADLIARSGRSKDEMRADALGIYESVLRDPKTTPRDRIRAQECIDKLHGLQMPFKLAFTDENGKGKAIKCIVGVPLDQL